MEDVLEVYARPYDPARSVVCMDEQPVQLLADSRPEIRLSPGNHTIRQDYEYVRCGTCCAFMFTEPLGGWREVSISETRKKTDWARQVKHLADNIYPDAEKIVLVCDNLNTHDLSSFYEAFPPSESRRLCDKIEMHHTPKHGSWLDMAELELSAFTSQCLNRRISSIESLQKEATAWYTNRNLKQKGIAWRFSADDARIKLRHLYPVLEFND